MLRTHSIRTNRTRTQRWRVQIEWERREKKGISWKICCAFFFRYSLRSFDFNALMILNTFKFYVYFFFFSLMSILCDLFIIGMYAFFLSLCQGKAIERKSKRFLQDIARAQLHLIAFDCSPWIQLLQFLSSHFVQMQCRLFLILSIYIFIFGSFYVLWEPYSMWKYWTVL